MPVICKTVIDWLEEWAPPLLSEDWDHIGLQVGSPDTEIKKVLVTLEATPEVVAEAVRQRVQLIVSHHPLIWDPLVSLNYNDYPASLVVQLVESRIHFYAAHTNMDAAAGGINDILAERLGLTDLGAMRPAPQEKLYKLVIYIPRGHEDLVRQAICQAGAGWIGQYDECTFQAAGTGTFRPLPGTNPFLGQIGQLERTEEIRLETVVAATRLEAVIGAMLNAHPYEEVAYDLYHLQNRFVGKTGLGRVGRLPEPKPLRAFAEQARKALGLPAVRMAGDPDQIISRVALCGGGGMSLLKWALRADADVYVTGDVRHHDAQNALGQGIAVIDAGHHATERVIAPAMAAYLTNKAAAAGELLEVVVSQVNTDPFSRLTPAISADHKEAPMAEEPVRIMEPDPTGGDPIPGAVAAAQVSRQAPGKLLIYIDGASRGNPGDAGAGVLVLDEKQQPLVERKEYLGHTTNNVAEYRALILALQEALDIGAVRVEIKTDSELLARQWNGQYRVQNSGLVPLMQQARRLASQLQSCMVSHVPRSQNKRADALANLGIDEHNKHSRPE